MGTVVYVHTETAVVETRKMRTGAEVEALARSIAATLRGCLVYGDDHRLMINEEGVALIAAHLIDRAPPGAKSEVL